MTTKPAQYKTVKVVQQVEPPQEKKTTIPAVYEEVAKRVKVSDADMEWREILCETNAALIAYQKDNDLPSGNLTIGSLEHLGVEL